jgi:hypothetical protein
VRVGSARRDTLKTMCRVSARRVEVILDEKKRQL